jgi:hypothetical protein
MLWVTFGGLFWAVEKRVRLVFRGFWRNGSRCRRAALVLVLFLGCRLPVSFLPLCMYVYGEMCGWAQTTGSIGEAGGGFLFIWGAVGGWP